MKINKLNSINLALIAIFIVALVIRFYKLSLIPPALNWDEAALGYNGYSIFKTGRDEYGTLLPLVFKSFGDFKPGIYVYLTTPFILLFGLSEFSVRAPSVLFGSLSVLLVYFLVKELFNDKKIALFSSLFLALSPWHIILSRPAFESNLALFFNLLGMYSFAKFVRTKKFTNFMIMILSFIFSLYTYQSSKLFVPIIMFGLFWFWYKSVLEIPRKYLIFTLLFLLSLAWPLYFGSFFGGQGGRLKVFSLFSYPQTQNELDRFANYDNASQDDLTFKLFHNQPYYFLRIIASHYFNYFSARFLFFEGDYQNLRTSVPHNGVMYLFDIVLLAFGIYALVRRNFGWSAKFLIYWLAIAPLPGVLSRDLVTATRAFNLVVPLVILSAIGAQFLLNLAKQNKMFFSLAGVLLIFALWNILFFIDLYFVHYSKIASKDWLFGYKQAVFEIQNHYGNFDNVIFTTAYNEPYIFVLFYTKYPPSQYQKQATLELVRGEFDVGEVPRFDKFTFRPIYWPEDRNLKKTLFVGTGFEIPLSDLKRDEMAGLVTQIAEVKFLNGEVAFRIVGSK